MREGGAKGAAAGTAAGMTEGGARGAAEVGTAVKLGMGVCAEAKLTWGSRDDVLALRLLVPTCTGVGSSMSPGPGAG